MRPSAWRVLAALLLLPSAGAAEVQGQLFVEGPVVLEKAGGEAVFTPRIVVTNATSTLRSLVFQAPVVKMYAYEIMGAFTHVPHPVHAHLPGTQREDLFELHNATIRMGSTAARGLLALNDTVGEARLLAADDLRLAPSDFTDLQDVEASPRRPSFRNEHHLRQWFEGTHLVMSGSGILHYEGPGSLKIHGVDLRVEADEGSFSIPTRWEYQGVGVQLQSIRWAVLEFPDGVLHAETSAPWVAIAEETGVSAAQMTVLRSLRGGLEGEGARFAPTGEAAVLRGLLQGRAWPLDEGERLLVVLDLEGDVRGTTLRTEGGGLLAASSGAGGLLWLLLAALAVGGGGFGAASLLQRRRERAHAIPLSFAPEDCAALAARAIDAEAWPAALEWLSRARALAPTSARVCADLAYATAQVGEAGEALRLFEEARRLGADDAETHYHAARAALAARRPPAEVEAWIRSALEKAPTLVLDLQEGAFEALRGRPGFEEVVARAWERLAGADEPPSPFDPEPA